MATQPETEEKRAPNSLPEPIPSIPPDKKQQAERKFLSGPQRRGFELRLAWDIFVEFIRGFRKLHFVGPCVTVFGSARFKEDHPYYAMARAVGKQLSETGFTVMTGGGPGIMEAANRGAKDVNGPSIGCNIKLPHEQYANPYLDVMVEFDHFFVRKTMLIKYSYAFIALPGGFGTFDEIFEALTLIQTGKIQNFPVVLMGKDYWQPLMDMMDERLLREKTISPEDLKLLFITDSPEEAVSYVRDIGLSKFGLSYGAKVKRRWFLLEWGG